MKKKKNITHSQTTDDSKKKSGLMVSGKFHDMVNFYLLNRAGRLKFGPATVSDITYDDSIRTKHTVGWISFVCV